MLSEKQTQEFFHRNIVKDPAIAMALEKLTNVGLLEDNDFDKSVAKLTQSFDAQTAKGIVDYHNHLVERSRVHKAQSQLSPPHLPSASIFNEEPTTGKIGEGHGRRRTNILPGAE